MAAMTPPVDINLTDKDSERVRRSHAQAIRELQASPAPVVVRNVTCFANGIVLVAHRLGREPLAVVPSAIRWDKAPFVAPGTILDYGSVGNSGEPIDRTKVVLLGALAFTSLGAVRITFDVVFF